MAIDNDIFSVIEDVISQRAGKDGYTAKEMCLDVLSVATEKGQTLSTREVYQILMKLNQPISRGTCNRAVTDLRDEGRIEYVRKEYRPSIQRMAVPVYRAIIDSSG